MSTTQQPENQRNLAFYRERFDELNVSITERGKAPYKPILLLSVIDLIAQGLIKDNHIYITNELINTFNKYKNILSPDKKFDSTLSLPFFHLKNEDVQFWHLDFNTEEYDASPQTNEKIRKSITQLKKYVNSAYIDRELFNLIQNEDSRQELVDKLLAKLFSLSEDKIGDVLKTNQAFQDSIQKRTG
ncbi:MAG: hypothetical protein F6K28_25065 [Microcoleus sp. SIO2G3]|nr:hypothetical protein [Microcoleus sp. SIO2G3]